MPNAPHPEPPSSPVAIPGNFKKPATTSAFFHRTTSPIPNFSKTPDTPRDSPAKAGAPGEPGNLSRWLTAQTRWPRKQRPQTQSPHKKHCQYRLRRQFCGFSQCQTRRPALLLPGMAAENLTAATNTALACASGENPSLTSTKYPPAGRQPKTSKTTCSTTPLKSNGSTNTWVKIPRHPRRMRRTRQHPHPGHLGQWHALSAHERPTLRNSLSHAISRHVERRIIEPERIVDDLINFVDFAPTFLEAAGIEHPSPNHWQKPSCPSSNPANRASSTRSAPLSSRAKNATTSAVPAPWAIPSAASATTATSTCETLNPTGWPAGNPEVYYRNIDDSPTKTRVVEEKEQGNETYWQLCMGKRPKEEL